MAIYRLLRSRSPRGFRGFRSNDSSLSRRRPPDLLRRVCRDEVCSKKNKF